MAVAVGAVARAPRRAAHQVSRSRGREAQQRKAQLPQRLSPTHLQTAAPRRPAPCWTRAQRPAGMSAVPYDKGSRAGRHVWGPHWVASDSSRHRAGQGYPARHCVRTSAVTASFLHLPSLQPAALTLDVSTISLYASQPDSNLPAAYHAQQLGGHQSTQGAWQTAGAGIQQVQCMPSMPSEHSTARQLQQRQGNGEKQTVGSQPAR